MVGADIAVKACIDQSLDDAVHIEAARRGQVSRLAEVELALVADLAQMKDKDLLAMNNLGKAALQDIRQKQSEFIKNLLTEVVTEEIERISIGNIDSDAQGGTA